MDAYFEKVKEVNFDIHKVPYADVFEPFLFFDLFCNADFGCIVGDAFCHALFVCSQWYDRCCKRYSFGSEYVAGICRYGWLFVEEGLFER